MLNRRVVPERLSQATSRNIDRLQQVRTDGNTSLGEVLSGSIVIVSDQVVKTTRAIQQLERRDIDRVLESDAGHTGVLLLRQLMKQPVVRVCDIEEALKISYSKANSLAAEMETLGVLKQITAGRRNRKFKYNEYVQILSEGTEPVPRG